MREWAGKYAQQLTALTLETYGLTCHLCGEPGADTADHILPRSAGGDDSLDNPAAGHHQGKKQADLPFVVTGQHGSPPGEECRGVENLK